MVKVEAAVLEGFSRAVQTLYALICVVGRLLASKTPARIQAELDVLTGLFDHVGIQNNVVNMVGMTCLLCLTYRSLS